MNSFSPFIAMILFFSLCAGGATSSGDDGDLKSKLIAFGESLEFSVYDMKDISPTSVPIITGSVTEIPRAFKCMSDKCFALLPSPARKFLILDRTTMKVLKEVALPNELRAQDFIILSENRLIISFSEGLSLLDLSEATFTWNSIVPDDQSRFEFSELGQLASCKGDSFFVQAAVTKSKGGKEIFPSIIIVPWQALVDFDHSVEWKSVRLNRAAKFDMSADCKNKQLYVIEPVPIFDGESQIEIIDLNTTEVAPFSTNLSGEFGNMYFSKSEGGWALIHTEFGPGPSTHLSWIDNIGNLHPMHDTFTKNRKIDDLVVDEDSGTVYFPDSCSLDVTPNCRSGIHSFKRGGKVGWAAPLKTKFLIRKLFLIN